MPTAKESAVNRPLSGKELRARILADCTRLVDACGELQSYMAFGRVAYTLKLTLHLDNMINPESTTTLPASAVSDEERKSAPAMSALEGAVPLVNPSPDAIRAEHSVERRISSPNAERVRLGLPVPVDRKQQDGTTVTEEIKYPDDMAKDVGAGDVSVDGKRAES